MGKGIFIVIDGMDGAGKGELIQRLQSYIFSKDKKNRIMTTREPTMGIFGREIRKILKEDNGPEKNAETLLELFIKDREEHLNKTIIPFLDNVSGDNVNIVLCDRYYHSTIAFQHAQGIEMKKLLDMNRKFRKPDLALILDLNPEIALKRLSARQKEKFEQIDFMKRLRENFLSLNRHIDDNIKVIDASKSAEEVFESVKKEIGGIV